MDPAARVILPDIGYIGWLAHLYLRTPHWQAAWARFELGLACRLLVELHRAFPLAKPAPAH